MTPLSFSAFRALLSATMLIAVLLPVALAWRVCRKSGYGGAAALLLVIPLVNVVAVYWFARGRRPEEST